MLLAVKASEGSPSVKSLQAAQLPKAVAASDATTGTPKAKGPGSASSDASAKQSPSSVGGGSSSVAFKRAKKS